MELRWIASSSTSALHAAAAIANRCAIADSRLFSELEMPAHVLRTAIHAIGGDDAMIWGHVLALSAGIENDQQLAEVALVKAIGRSNKLPALKPGLASAIRDVEVAFRSALPRIVDELELRSAPLREQWEARGPGLLHYLSLATDPTLFVESADVVCVHPILGGGGAAHPQYNSVRIEAVLANPLPQLPEVLRLAWLLAQLNLDLPDVQGNLQRTRVHELGAWALIPAILQSAEIVELAQATPANLALAITNWSSSTLPAAALAEILGTWWLVYRDSRPRWSLALAALDRMVQVAPPIGSVVQGVEDE